MAQKRNNLILAIAVFAISIMVFLPVIFLTRTIEGKDVYVKLEVSSISGFDLNSSSLTFGAIMPGNSVSRNLIVENSYDFPVKISISASGEIEPFLRFEKITLIKIGEKKKIGITASIPDNAEYGKYEGMIKVKIKREYSKRQK